MWSDPKELGRLDLYSIYSERTINPLKKRNLDGNAEDRHQMIQDQITNQVRSFAHEPRLNNVIRSTYFREKETIKRENLARLLKSSKQLNDLNYNNLAKESTIARNNITAEHIVASRNMREWKDQVLAELHKEKRQDSIDAAPMIAKRRQHAKSQALTHRDRAGQGYVIRRIY